MEFQNRRIATAHRSIAFSHRRIATLHREIARLDHSSNARRRESDDKSRGTISMDIFSPQFLSALAAIVVIDLALAGDNAIVIALAARNLPPALAKKAIVWGTLGAIVVRCAMTLAVVWLLGVPGLMGAGGVVLVWIAFKLLRPQEGAHGPEVVAATGFWSAMQTIVIADAAMGLDNVLAVAGAAHGSFTLVVLGLLISIPIVIWGSTLILVWVERYPWIVQVGVAVLAWTAAKMIIDEPLMRDFFASNPAARYATYIGVVGGVFAAGHAAARRRRVSEVGA
jgi:YjbE family integral membrane protein